MLIGGAEFTNPTATYPVLSAKGYTESGRAFVLHEAYYAPLSCAFDAPEGVARLVSVDLGHCTVLTGAVEVIRRTDRSTLCLRIFVAVQLVFTSPPPFSQAHYCISEHFEHDYQPYRPSDSGTHSTLGEWYELQLESLRNRKCELELGSMSSASGCYTLKMLPDLVVSADCIFVPTELVQSETDI